VDTKLFVNNMQVQIPTKISTGIYNTDDSQVPQGQVIKLSVAGLPEAQSADSEQANVPPLFGAHIREGIAVVKDWMKKS
jgi:hypothetical protein